MLSAFIDGFIAVFWLVGFVTGLSTVIMIGYFLNALLRGKKRLIKPKRRKRRNKPTEQPVKDKQAIELVRG